MRGKGVLQHVQFVVERIPPAYAGKSLHLHHIYSFYQDHPRLCGEKPVDSVKPSASWGITPAYAGKSSRYIDFERSTQDHPRLCGEKV